MGRVAVDREPRRRVVRRREDAGMPGERARGDSEPARAVGAADDAVGEGAGARPGRGGHSERPRPGQSSAGPADRARKRLSAAPLRRSCRRPSRRMPGDSRNAQCSTERDGTVEVHGRGAADERREGARGEATVGLVARAVHRGVQGQVRAGKQQRGFRSGGGHGTSAAVRARSPHRRKRPTRMAGSGHQLSRRHVKPLDNLVARPLARTLAEVRRHQGQLVDRPHRPGVRVEDLDPLGDSGGPAHPGDREVRASIGRSALFSLTTSIVARTGACTACSVTP